MLKAFFFCCIGLIPEDHMMFHAENKYAMESTFLLRDSSYCNLKVSVHLILNSSNIILYLQRAFFHEAIL